MANGATYVHGGVDLSDGLVIGGELVDLNSIADQLAGDLELELGQLALGDGIRLGDDWNNIYLQWRNKRFKCKSSDAAYITLSSHRLNRA